MNPGKLAEDFRWATAPSQGISPLWLALAAAALLAAAACAWWFWRRKKIAAESAPPRPPHEIALEELSRLRAAMTADNYLEFIVGVSRILRAYIQARFGLRAPHRSTEEFLLEAAESPEIDPARQTLLGDFLRQCDLVKFARRQAALDRMADLFSTAEQFVRDTSPTPEEIRGEALAP